MKRYRLVHRFDRIPPLRPGGQGGEVGDVHGGVHGTGVVRGFGEGAEFGAADGARAVGDVGGRILIALPRPRMPAVEC